MIALKNRSFLIQKEKEKSEDCQDSVFPAPGESDSNGNAYAVSDGTTTSFLSRSWAQILTRRFAEETDSAFENWGRWLEGAQTEWKTEAGKRAAQQSENFILNNKFRAGEPAAATFVGLRLRPNGSSAPWEALVLGDSCLFHLTADGECQSYLLNDSRDFSNVTEAAESYSKAAPHRPHRLDTKQPAEPGLSVEPAREGDVFLLASDAFSKWLLQCHERGKPVWGSLLELGNRADFERLVSDARGDAEYPLNNDDVALNIIEVGSASAKLLRATFQPTPKRAMSAAPAPAPDFAALPDQWPDGSGRLSSATGEPARKTHEDFASSLRDDADPSDAESDPDGPRKGGRNPSVPSLGFYLKVGASLLVTAFAAHFYFSSISIPPAPSKPRAVKRPTPSPGMNSNPSEARREAIKNPEPVQGLTNAQGAQAKALDRLEAENRNTNEELEDLRSKINQLENRIKALENPRKDPPGAPAPSNQGPSPNSE